MYSVFSVLTVFTRKERIFARISPSSLESRLLVALLISHHFDQIPFGPQQFVQFVLFTPVFLELLRLLSDTHQTDFTARSLS